MTDINPVCSEFSKTIQSSFDALKSQHADEIFDLQRAISKLQDRVSELEHPVTAPIPDPLLTKERFVQILREEHITPRPEALDGHISVWHKVGDRKKKITICACRTAFKSAMGDQEIWLGTNVDDTDVFTGAHIPIADFAQAGLTRARGCSGRFYTTEPVHESTLRKVIAELKK